MVNVSHGLIVAGSALRVCSLGKPLVLWVNVLQTRCQKRTYHFGGWSIYMINVGITISKSTHDWEWFIPTIYGDDLGMVYYCYTHIISKYGGLLGGVFHGSTTLYNLNCGPKLLAMTNPQVTIWCTPNVCFLGQHVFPSFVPMIQQLPP